MGKVPRVAVFLFSFPLAVVEPQRWLMRQDRLKTSTCACKETDIKSQWTCCLWSEIEEKGSFWPVTLVPNKRKMQRGKTRGRGWKRSEWEVRETRGWSAADAPVYWENDIRLMFYGNGCVYIGVWVNEKDVVSHVWNKVGPAGGASSSLTVTEVSLQSWGGLMKTKKVKGRTDEGALASPPATETRKCSRIILILVLVEQITGLNIFS